MLHHFRYPRTRQYEDQTSMLLSKRGPLYLLVAFWLLPLSTIMRGISFSAGEEHLIRFPSTKPFISARSSKVQLTPAESSGTLWASRTNCKREKKRNKDYFRNHYQVMGLYTLKSNRYKKWSIVLIKRILQIRAIRRVHLSFIGFTLNIVKSFKVQSVKIS